MAYHRTGGAKIERLIQLFSRLPGLGPRSATRAALTLLRHPESRLQPLVLALEEASHALTTCSICGTLDERDPCGICADPTRDKGLICVVENVGDLWALERAMTHDGVYHVLGGTLSALEGRGPDEISAAALLARVAEGNVREVILALGATVEGATTAHWLHEQLRSSPVCVSFVGRGVPMGGTLDGLDDGTLIAALASRRTTP